MGARIPAQAVRLAEQKRLVKAKLLQALAAKQPMVMAEVHAVTGYVRLGSSCNLVSELLREGKVFRCRFRLKAGRGPAESYVFADRAQFEQFRSKQAHAAAIRLDQNRKAYEDQKKAERKAKREAAMAARQAKRDAAAAERESVRQAKREEKEARARAREEERAAAKIRKAHIQAARAETIRVKPPRKRRPSGRHNCDNAVAEILRRERARELAQIKPDPVPADFSRAKRTEIPTPPELLNRWHATLPPQGGVFSSLRPGVYAFGPASCAAKGLS